MKNKLMKTISLILAAILLLAYFSSCVAKNLPKELDPVTKRFQTTSNIEIGGSSICGEYYFHGRNHIDDLINRCQSTPSFSLVRIKVLGEQTNIINIQEYEHVLGNIIISGGTNTKVQIQEIYEPAWFWYHHEDNYPLYLNREPVYKREQRQIKYEETNPIIIVREAYYEYDNKIK